MTKKVNKVNTNNSTTEKIKKILVGSLSGCVILIISLLLFSALILKNDLKSASLSAFAFTACSISSLVGGFITAKLVKMSGLLYGVASSALTVVLTLVLTLIFGENLGKNFLFAVIMMLISSAIGGILGGKVKKKPRYR